MDNFSSEALKAGIKPNKPVEEITYCIMEAYEKINC